MKKIIWILTLGLSMASTLQAQEMNNLTKRSYKQGDRISIIGAGATGLAIARTLVNEGVPPQNITVIEKESEAGGKVKSIKAEG
ncbi:MAG TPA: FAD/NAD(P)-binding protein, partial [Bdellovibrio sp.]|nr:FAD/NAD(P)-binding protein [Bdellovibrio sp.]